ncbi:MAG: hypothetical protein D6785_00115, partial [Planctomycetota bacterium]
MERQNLNPTYLLPLAWAIYSFLTLSLPYLAYLYPLLPQWATFKWFLYSQAVFIILFFPFFLQYPKDEPSSTLSFSHSLPFLWLPLIIAFSSLSEKVLSLLQYTE